MDPGAVPIELQGLTEIEEMLIARACPVMCVYRKHGGQRGYKGHVLNLPQDVKGFLTRLPANVAELPFLVIRRHGANNTHKDCRVRRQKVLQALTWLRNNNPYYADIEIDHEALQALPVDGIPSNLPTIDDQRAEEEDREEDSDQGPPQNDASGSEHDSRSFLPLPHAQQPDQDAIRAFINGEDPLDWPSNEGDPINEFQTEGLATMAFPALFPHGRGDPTKKRRLREVKLTEGFKHLIRYAEPSLGGQFVWRFASHSRFPYWALNMKQRHQLLSQARIYLSQNPQDANLTTEQLQEMVGQMSAQQLMNRLQRYVAKIQGTKQYWYQRYLELKALIEQKGAPTFFFTFSAADNYWPDLHRLLQEPNNATMAVRVKAVIDHPHLTDSYFLSRLEEFNSHWLDHVMNAEWKWLRYEWQARGSIHAHGCAKLKNDPGLCDLVNTAAQGWKFEKILHLQEEGPVYQQMVNDFRPAIEAGQQAQARVIEYADWLVTTINEALPEENWSVPNPHPSAVPFQETRNEDDDYHSMVNSVERHTRCSTAYCIRTKPGQPPQCRFKYPKECQEQTTLDFELIVKGAVDEENGLTVQQITEARVKATLTTKRNDDRINTHNRVMLQHWRANVDLQAIVDTDQCIRYMAKYATKGEPRSQPVTDILNTAISRLHSTDPASSALRRAMIQVAGDRDIGSQETAHMLLGRPLYSCTYSFLSISLDGSRRVRGGEEEGGINQSEEALDASVRDHYASRAQWQDRYPGLLQLNLLQFASAYYVTKEAELRQRRQEVIVRTFPAFSPNPSGKNYGKYCMYQLLKYKPWSGSVTSAWDDHDESDGVYIQCYRDFLSSDVGQQCVPMFAQELEQAELYQEEGPQDDVDDDEQPQQHEEDVEEWMLLCRLNQQYSDDATENSSSQDNSSIIWSAAASNMPQNLLRESATWITKRRNEAREEQSVNNHQLQRPVNLLSLNSKQRLAYNIVQQHHDCLSRNIPREPLNMIIMGTAGTGKSYLINALTELLGEECILTATTGIAGFNIHGCTLHSVLQLPVRKHNNTDLQGAALQRIQLRFVGKQYLIVDEMSMLGQQTLAWVDKRLRQATGKLNSPLGGISVLILGDFGQLPPVGGRPMYAPLPGTVLGDHGYSIYTLFRSVVALTENIRQAGSNPEAERFRELLLRMRDGRITLEDWYKLQERAPQNINMEHFKNAIRLFFDKASVARYNYEKLQRLGAPIARMSAVHSGPGASAAKSDDAGGLESEVFLARGASVMLTSNLWQEVGLCNGASGTVQDLLFHPEKPPPCLPIAVLVQFPHYRGPAFMDSDPLCIPIPPHLFEWEHDGKKLSRLQLPLRLCYSMTIHKSQGQTLSQAVIDIGKAEKAAGCTFVATSRVRSLQHAVFQPMSFQRLQAIGKSKRLQERLTEEQRLHDLADMTAQQYEQD